MRAAGTDEPGSNTAAVAAADGLAAPRQKPLVLVVEDDFLLRGLIAEFLADNGYDVESAADGLEALMRLDSTFRRPSVILVDVTMPRMDGIEFLEHQKALPALANIPVIAMTGSNSQRSSFIGLGFRDVFFKPLDMSKLLQFIREL